MDAFCSSIGWEMPESALIINREEVYAKGHIPLENLGEDIV